MKLIIAAIALIGSIVLGANQPAMCMDPNTNTPIDCSLVGR